MVSSDSQHNLPNPLHNIFKRKQNNPNSRDNPMLSFNLFLLPKLDSSRLFLPSLLCSNTDILVDFD